MAGGQYRFKQVKVSTLFPAKDSKRTSPARALLWASNRIRELMRLHLRFPDAAEVHWKEGGLLWHVHLSILARRPKQHPGVFWFGAASELSDWADHAKRLHLDQLPRDRASQRASRGEWCEEALEGGARLARAYSKLAKDHAFWPVETLEGPSAALQARLAQQ
eukprot:3726537-Pyramimonas_sp.AAC.1